ncbi:hypothetical protein EHQ95_14895 [Leptospira vanthielii]|uniref:Uncharacterized protein n=2 Tax=Leptospira vanthielii TaxID=293085 RepID=A0ABY2NLZ4_9LEPT|nr:UL73 viral envelope glycoprotein domain protein [Leptospira vanthielii serovar Holland str. Waz Holland = ATCC 700522]TGM51586.1 hypothetical protein EHQ95_14895 [Leptospira vanthielii]
MAFISLTRSNTLLESFSSIRTLIGMPIVFAELGYLSHLCFVFFLKSQPKKDSKFIGNFV